MADIIMDYDKFLSSSLQMKDSVWTSWLTQNPPLGCYFVIYSSDLRSSLLRKKKYRRRYKGIPSLDVILLFTRQILEVLCWERRNIEEGHISIPATIPATSRELKRIFVNGADKTVAECYVLNYIVICSILYGLLFLLPHLLILTDFYMLFTFHFRLHVNLHVSTCKLFLFQFQKWPD